MLIFQNIARHNILNNLEKIILATDRVNCEIYLRLNMVKKALIKFLTNLLENLESAIF